MPRLLPSLLALVVCALPVVAGPVGYAKVGAAGVSAHVVSVDLNDPGVRVTAGAAESFPRAAERFSDFVARTSPAAAITGTFFGGHLSLVGDVVVAGKMLHYGRQVGTPIAVTGGRQVSFPLLKEGRLDAWEGYSTVVCAGPRLLKDGRCVLNARKEGFRDRRLFGRARRCAIGLTAKNKLLLVATTQNITLGQLAAFMKGIGAVEAVNLDGGSSTGLYYGGSFAVKPGRNLTNFISVYTSAESYAQARPQLVPIGFLEGGVAPLDPALAGIPVAGGSQLGVRITSPQPGATVNGAIQVAVQRADKAVSYAVISVDGSPSCITNNLPFSHRLDTTGLADGPHTIAAVGFREDGTRGAVAQVQVQVANHTAGLPAATAVIAPAAAAVLAAPH